MTQRHTWLAALGIAAAGCSTDGGARPDPVPGPPETTPFTPSLCTSDPPGTASCPINSVSLGELGVEAQLSFVMQSLGSGLFLNRIEVVAGAEGLYLEHPSLRLWSNPETPSTQVVAFGVILNLAPGQ